jgi:hypothetical protein
MCHDMSPALVHCACSVLVCLPAFAVVLHQSPPPLAALEGCAHANAAAKFWRNTPHKRALNGGLAPLALRSPPSPSLVWQASP